MRLIVASRRSQAMALRKKYPNDKVVLVGDALYGYRVTEIINMTSFQFGLSATQKERVKQWWDYAQCRVLPQEEE